MLDVYLVLKQPIILVKKMEISCLSFFWGGGGCGGGASEA